MREQILRTVQDELGRLPHRRDLRSADPATWTRAVKSAVRRAVVHVAGQVPGLCICISANDLEEQDVAHEFDHQREWLFDIACLQYTDRFVERGIPYFERPLKNVLLVGECEWGHERMIHNDFEKLLLARADIKLMVFDGSNLPDAHKFSELKELVSQFSHSHTGDTYLLAAWSERGFEFDLHSMT